MLASQGNSPLAAKPSSKLFVFQSSHCLLLLTLIVSLYSAWISLYLFTQISTLDHHLYLPAAHIAVLIAFRVDLVLMSGSLLPRVNLTTCFRRTVKFDLLLSSTSQLHSDRLTNKQSSFVRWLGDKSWTALSIKLILSLFYKRQP